MRKPPTNPTEKLFDLLEQIHEGDFSDSSRTELNDLLRRHPELVHDFIEYREQCASLWIMHLYAGKPSGKAPVLPPIKTGTLDEMGVDDGSTTSGFGSALPFTILLLTLSFIAMALGVFSLTEKPTVKTPLPVAAMPSPTVAKLVAMHECRWASPYSKEAPRVGQEFSQGTVLKLESGLVQMDYRSGVKIFFQGPGQLELTEVNAVCLHAGVITSRVSPQAIGFTVNTPTSVVVDHGTEFVVGVDKNHQTDVSVLEGKVELKNRQDSQTSDSQMLTAGQSLRLDSKGKIELFRTIDPKQLAQNIKESEEAKRHNTKVSIYRFRSAGELKLKGTLIKAINAGEKKGFQVGKIYFEPDDPSICESPRCKVDWGNRPWFGNSPEDQALCHVLSSIRTNYASHNHPENYRDLPVFATFPARSGRYRIQLLISENYHIKRGNLTDRSINLDVEGVPCLRDLRILASQGIAGHPVPPNQALLIDVETDVTDGELNIKMFAQDTPAGIDPNVILNALIVERL